MIFGAFFNHLYVRWLQKVSELLLKENSHVLVESTTNQPETL